MQRGLTIPPRIWGMQDLGFQEKGFLAEIVAVADNDNTCELTNDDFAAVFGLSTPRCSEIISRLDSKGLISVERLRDGHRRIRRITHNLPTNDNKPTTTELSGLSQCERVKLYMERNGSITAEEARIDLGIARLASRITDLRQQGVAIDKEMVELPNRFGETCRVARYSLGGEA